MGGSSAGTSEALIVISVGGSFPQYPPEIDFATRSDSGSIEYSYLGTFENAFDISGRGLEGHDGWLRTGLYLTGEKGIGSVIFDGDRFYPVYQREIINTGTISGDDYSIYSESMIETRVRNEGEMIGDVALGDGLDHLINTGRISGAIFAGDEDVLSFNKYDLIENHGVITGPVNLGAGDDTFTSFGDARVGSKTKPAAVRGMDGNDTLTGADRDDKFFGGQGRDKLIGHKGDDRLFGNSDDDVLRGGAGEDLIAGGRGKDLLFGGAGNDVFQFRSIKTSERGALADRIKDFQQGEDHIDLSSVAQEIDFIGSEAFSGAGNAEVRFVSASNGTARVLVDADGDGAIDMRINVRNTTDLLETDFIL